VEPVLTILAVLLLAIPMGYASAMFVRVGAGQIARVFMPPEPRRDWPVGVQEDDDFRWRWTNPEPRSPEKQPTQHGVAPASASVAEVAVLEELEPGSGPDAGPVRRALSPSRGR
jgi:hypothetical protein